MEFFEYLYQFLTRPFRKQVGTFESWLQVMAKLLDDLKEAVYKVRRLWFVQTSSGKALELHGSARHVGLYPGEPEELYKRRILAILEAQGAGGSIEGLETLLDMLGFSGSKVLPMYKETESYIEAGGIVLDGSWDLDGSQMLESPFEIKAEYLGRWAEFIVILELGNEDRRFLLEDYYLLVDMLDRARNAHELLAEVLLRMRTITDSTITLKSKILSNESFRLQIGQYELLDGTRQATITSLQMDGSWKLDGKYNLDVTKYITGWKLGLNLPGKGLALTEIFELDTGDFQEDAWLLDGGGYRWKMDGSWLLDGGAILLDSSHSLDGSWLLDYTQHLGDYALILDGSRVLGGRMLKGIHLGCSFRVYEDSLLIEEVKI